MKTDQNGFTLIEGLLILGVVIVVGLAGFLVYKFSHHSDGSDSGIPIMIVEYVGTCPPTYQDPDGAVCNTDYSLYSNGDFQGHTNLSSSEVNQLQTAINTTDFLQYPTNPDPTCQSSDGQNETLAFPQKYPNMSFELCKLQIPSTDPIVGLINQLIQSHTEN